MFSTKGKKEKKKWNAHCRDDLVVMVVVEREREREGGSGVCLCVSFWQSFHPWGPFEMEIYTPEESRVARTRWGALALCRQAIGG
jgi:hypothetical protein